jgi:hypothetical protein
MGMKARNIITEVMLVLCLWVVLTGCVTVKKAYVPSEDEEFYGVWYNAENDEVVFYKPDGTFEDYFWRSELPRWYGTFTIKDKWVDREGNIWYRTVVENQVGVTRYMLNRIDHSGRVLENVFYSNDYPVDLDRNLMSYRIFERQ